MLFPDFKVVIIEEFTMKKMAFLDRILEKSNNQSKNICLKYKYTIIADLYNFQCLLSYLFTMF